MSWLDFGMLLDDPKDIISLVDSLSLTSFPVFLLTYADLLEATEPLLYLMRHRPLCTFLFIPSRKMAVAVEKLMKQLEVNVKAKSKSKVLISNEEGHYQMLMSSILSIQTEQLIPIAMFNSPKWISEDPM